MNEFEVVTVIGRPAIEADSRGFFKLAEPLVIRLAKRQAEAGTESLKALLEENAF